MKYIFTFVFIYFSVQAAAQQKRFELKWDLTTDVSHRAGHPFVVPGFAGSNFKFNAAEQKVVFKHREKIDNYISDVEVKNIQTRPVSSSKLNNLEKSEIPSAINLKWSLARGRSQRFLQLQFSPLIKENNQYKRVTEIEFSYQSSFRQTKTTNSTNSFIQNSVFANGDFYRIPIRESGVYRLSYTFLKNLGMGVSQIDLQTLKIYGHGGDMLPLKNDLTEYNDPPEQAIKIQDGGDGSFDSGDAVLFYAKGVDDKWSQENQTNLNLYADQTYYYITTSGGQGRRVSPHAQPSGQVSKTLNTFDDYKYYETDEISVANLGRRWVSDRFGVENQRSYDFNFPNLVTDEPVNVRAFLVSASEVSTSFSVTVNASDQTSLSFSPLGEFDYGDVAGFDQDFSINQDDVTVDLTYNNSGNPASLGYLDFINVKAKRQLIAADEQFEFTNEETALSNGIGEYIMDNASQITEVWDVTNPGSVTSFDNSDQSNTLTFKVNMGQQRRYVALAANDYKTPVRENRSRVDNINLKGNVFNTAQGGQESPDFLIITNKLLSQQAQRLAQHRRSQDGLNTKVVLIDDIYREFNSGKQDVAAIRNFIKYVYDNADNSNERLKYVCLFGDGSVDYKNRLQNDRNLVPVFEKLNSFSLGASSAPSDDFYGMMDADEGRLLGGDMLDLAVGRIAADDPQDAKILVDKVINYDSKEAYGSWRNNFLLISDDADVSGSAGYGLQVNLDEMGDEISENKPFVNVKKIHSDSYKQESSAGGFRYPEVNKDINENIEVGTLVVNYFGHGGEEGLSSERIVTRQSVQNWNNEDRYNLFITVTCEFTRFDNPARLSPGELVLRNPDGGSAALISTTRTIGVGAGAKFNDSLAPYIFDYENNNPSIAEAVRLAKNYTSSSLREVSFLGDPAMKLALPEPQVRLRKINNVPISQSTDTLKALEKVSFSGEVVDPGGNLISNYNGVLSSVLFDKRIDRETLGNDGTTDSNGNLAIFDFTTLGEILFRGKASVKNGKFEFEFVVPKDIEIPVGNGRISFYAERDNQRQDQKGVNTDVKIGGLNEDAPEDNRGPEIQLYMNDESFVSGGITNSSPSLLAKLADKNGINTASGIGHDLVAILDGDEENPYVVNDYYETEVDDYTKGKVLYKLRDLEEGPHTLRFKGWDVYNNSNTAEIQFVVAEDQGLKISKVLNYPNPFSTYTEFWFNHNRPMEPLQVQVQVFTVTGKVVWTHKQVVNTEGFLSRDITWDGKDDFGDAIGKGVYLYKLTVKSTVTNDKVEKIEKLVIL